MQLIPSNNFNFEPPRIAKLQQKDFAELINLAETKSLIDKTILHEFLNLKSDFLGQVNLGESTVIRAELYINRIPASNLTHFLRSYLFETENNLTKKLIFIAMYLAARKKYVEMISFTKLFDLSQVQDIYSSLHNYIWLV